MVNKIRFCQCNDVLKYFKGFVQKIQTSIIVYSLVHINESQKILFVRVKALEMRMRKCVLGLFVAPILPEKINKMLPLMP